MNKITVTIRPARAEDISGILVLMEQLAEHHRAIDSYYKPFSAYAGTLEDELADWLREKNMLVLVAEDRGKLIGYAHVSVQDAPAYASVNKMGVVYDLFVDERTRRSGIAKKIFAEAMAWFAKKKVKHIELSVDARNASGVAFWKSAGFEPFKLRMRHSID